MATQTICICYSFTSHDFTTFFAHFFNARPFFRYLKSLVIGPRLNTSTPLLGKTPARSLTPSHFSLPFGAGDKKETLATRYHYFHAWKEIAGIPQRSRLRRVRGKEERRGGGWRNSEETRKTEKKRKMKKRKTRGEEKRRRREGRGGRVRRQITEIPLRPRQRSHTKSRFGETRRGERREEATRGGRVEGGEEGRQATKNKT